MPIPLLAATTEALVFFESLDEASEITMDVHKSYPLERTAGAQRCVDPGNTTGNVVITV